LTTDPKITLLSLLSSNWDAEGVGFTPKFSTDWYDPAEEMPQVTVSHVITTQRVLGFSNDLTSASRKRNSVYAVDVWSKGEKAWRWKMIEEVARILKAKCLAPGGELEFIEVSDWRDLDESEESPKIYRSRVSLEVLYYA
jgi:hypothetical protein